MRTVDAGSPQGIPEKRGPDEEGETPREAHEGDGQGSLGARLGTGRLGMP